VVGSPKPGGFVEMAEEVKIEVLRPEDVDAALEEIYRDPPRAREFLERNISERESALARFAEEANADPAIGDAVRERPIEVLTERGLLEPLDSIQIDSLATGLIGAPFKKLFGPFLPAYPICRLDCRFVPRPIIEWICVTFLGWRFCYPRLRIELRWECRIVCY